MSRRLHHNRITFEWHECVILRRDVTNPHNWKLEVAMSIDSIYHTSRFDRWQEQDQLVSRPSKIYFSVIAVYIILARTFLIF